MQQLDLSTFGCPTFPEGQLGRWWTEFRGTKETTNKEALLANNQQPIPPRAVEIKAETEYDEDNEEARKEHAKYASWMTKVVGAWELQLMEWENEDTSDIVSNRMFFCFKTFVNIH